MTATDGLPVTPSQTIDEFCMSERICRQTLYNLWGRGKGPRFHYVGRSRRISPEARAEWHQRLEAEAASRSNGEAA
jgi:hypothetical protein